MAALVNHLEALPKAKELPPPPDVPLLGIHPVEMKTYAHAKTAHECSQQHDSYSHGDHTEKRL